MTIDTKIRRVTKSGANLFRELDFAPEEAERFQAESMQQIKDTKALKADSDSAYRASTTKTQP